MSSYMRAVAEAHLQRDLALSAWNRHLAVYAVPVRPRHLSRPRPGLSGNARQRRKEKRRRFRAALAAHQASAVAAAGAPAVSPCARSAGATPGTEDLSPSAAAGGG